MVPGYCWRASLATLAGPGSCGSGDDDRGLAVSARTPRGRSRSTTSCMTPRSREYRQFLTPAQFDQQFGVAAAESSAVSNWLTAGGLTIETTSAAGDYFTAEGTVAQLDQLFDVTIGSYTYDGERSWRTTCRRRCPTRSRSTRWPVWTRSTSSASTP